MGETGIYLKWPGLFFAIPGMIMLIVLPAALIYIVFKRTHLKMWAKLLLIPVCIVAPLLTTALWPYLVKISGFIGATGGDGTVPYDFVASKLFGDFSDYVWTGITTALVFFIFKKTDRKSPVG